MKKIGIGLVIKNLQKNCLLLVSAVAVLCLFVTPSLLSVLVTGVAFLAVTAAISLGYIKQADDTPAFLRVPFIVVTLLLLLIGYGTFQTTWAPSSKVFVLAQAFHLTTPILLAVVGLVGCAVGFYATYVLLKWLGIRIVSLYKTTGSPITKSEALANLKRNWFFPISALAFFCLSLDNSVEYVIGMLIAFGVMVLFSAQRGSIWDTIKAHAFSRKTLCLVSALGICLENQERFYMQAQKLMLPERFNAVFRLLGYFGAAVSLFFVVGCLVLFWEAVSKSVQGTSLLLHIKKSEWIIYAILGAVLVLFCAVAFWNSNAFYGGERYYDILYTSDSPALVQGRIYVALTHPENDLRQPLFAVFAAPFVGVPYLLGRVFGGSAVVSAFFINIAQIGMLFAANLMLAKMLQLPSAKRVCFMLLTFSTYTHILFSLMMEQYIVAYFWLVFCIYLFTEKGRVSQIAIWGAGGTLLTSTVLILLSSNKSRVKNFKAWMADIWRSGIAFVAMLITFGRFDVLCNFAERAVYLSDFTGRSVTLFDKLLQYIAFVRNCFVAPAAGVTTTVFSHISWQLYPITEISIAGIVILLLCIVSVIWNRDKKSSLLAGGWILFSVAMLFVLGWGTRENGLILYSLYFGWAFLVLLFQLAEKVESKLRIKFFVPVLSLGCSVALAAVNIPAVMEMVRFAAEYYPA